MAKTIVIKGADYETNALDTVAFDNVPCTAIALDKETVSILSIGGTATIVPTVTPSNTTDVISWESSDTDVATVENGVVTTIGVGVATITATCGTQTASCVVTSRAFMDTQNVLKRIGYSLSGTDAESGGNGLPDWRTENTRQGGIASNTGTLHFYGTSGAGIFPFILPSGTERVKVTFESNTIINIIIFEWFNKGTAASGYPEVCKLIKRQGNISFENNEYIADVPTVEGFPAIDSFAIGFSVPSGSTLTETAIDGVTVEFLPAAS